MANIWLTIRLGVFVDGRGNLIVILPVIVACSCLKCGQSDRRVYGIDVLCAWFRSVCREDENSNLWGSGCSGLGVWVTGMLDFDV